LLTLFAIANKFLLYSFYYCDEQKQKEKEAQYLQLAESWGKATVSRARCGPAYHVPKPANPLRAVRNNLKTPPPRQLKSGCGEKGQVADQAGTPHPVSGGEHIFSVMLGADGDPFYEPGDEPPCIPDGPDPQNYLNIFGYTPPPLLALNKNQLPPRSPSPSDYGEPLF
jgi:hypothetical protein